MSLILYPILNLNISADLFYHMSAEHSKLTSELGFPIFIINSFFKNTKRSKIKALDFLDKMLYK
jgi:hypothetical protein